jgi:hypothetical protein
MRRILLDVRKESEFVCPRKLSPNKIATPTPETNYVISQREKEFNEESLRRFRNSYDQAQNEIIRLNTEIMS